MREAAPRALDDAGLDWADIDALVIGKAPDAFEGIMQPELFLADALGAAGKPMLRVHTAGSVGGSTFIVGIAPRRVAASTSGCSRSRGRSRARATRSGASAGGKSGGIGAGGAFAPWIRAYIEKIGRARVHRLAGRGEGPAQRAEEPVRAPASSPTSPSRRCKESAMLWDPLRFLESCPSSDGACAMVVADDETAARRARSRRRGCSATSVRSELGQFPGRDPVRPQAGVECAHDVYKQAGITNPREQIDVAELYVPFSWYEPMWLEGHDIAGPGEGWKMVDSGATEITGSFPVNPSGGVLSSEPDRRVRA